MCRGRVKEMFVNIKCKKESEGGCMLNSHSLHQANQLPLRKWENVVGAQTPGTKTLDSPSLTPYLAICPHTALSRKLHALHIESSKSITLLICFPSPLSAQLKQIQGVLIVHRLLQPKKTGCCSRISYNLRWYLYIPRSTLFFLAEEGCRHV